MKAAVGLCKNSDLKQTGLVLVELFRLKKLDLCGVSCEQFCRGVSKKLRQSSCWWTIPIRRKEVE